MQTNRRCLTKEEITQKGLALDTSFCTMCGLCVAVCPASVIKLIQSGVEPRLSFGYGCNDCGICYRICPGRDVPLRDLDKFIFSRERDPKTEPIGIIQACYQANATDPEIRASGASGGVATALLVYALEKKQISAATVVIFDKEQPWKAKPILATTRRQIIDAANSKYTVIPVNTALAKPEINRLSGQLACVGLPCHVHGIRKLQYQYPSHPLSKKIAFIVGVHCAEARPMAYNEYILKEHLGLKSLDEIKSLNYRKGKPPNTRVEVIKTDGEVIEAGKYIWLTRAQSVFGRCMLCWDWGAELSDVSVGDFFGPAACGSDVHLGSSTLMVRTSIGEQLVRSAVEAGYLAVYPTPMEPVLRSWGFVGKKLGRAMALTAFKKHGLPCPDYQYQIEPIELSDKAALVCGLSIEERERFWACRGIHASS